VLLSHLFFLLILVSPSFLSFYFSSLRIVFLFFLTLSLLGTPIFITLFVNTSNLFKNYCVATFFSFLALQFLVICPSLPQPKHYFSCIALFLFICLCLSHFSCYLYSFFAFLSFYILISSILLYSFSIFFFSFLSVKQSSYLII